MSATVPAPRRGAVLRAAVAMDLRLQRRYGFWWATVVVVALWVGVLQLVPDALLGPAMPYLLMADLEFMTFFIAGAVFFDKGERTLFALLITPLRFGHYLAAKLLSMTALAVVTCVIVTLADFGWGVQPFAFSAGVVLMALLMILLGFVSAPLFPTISEWLLPATMLLAVASAPLLDYSGLVPHPAFRLVPTEGPLLLLGAAFGQVDLDGWTLTYALAYPVVWIAGLCLLARRVFDRHVVASEGGR
ncbi:ABC transporter permease [Pseudonocardia humida]|uniref:Fluoroquinolone transporter permease n=1 Tax=Pseudonocardia humida TaxID=2800819 RepID=A0ABT1ADX9_9PSEU|nr:ABC transporter permease [Pseudonocardia humida]MCO1661181.1 fluoroquinolone transporter permease [Pseudonocardia humida]